MIEELTPWEEETLALIHEAEKEKAKAEGRLEAVRREVNALAKEIADTTAVLNRYRRKHGISCQTIDHSPPLESDYGALTPKEMLHLWASRHDGDLVMRDLCHTAIAAGVYKNSSKAAATLYSVLRRLPGVAKIKPGHYSLKPQPILLINSESKSLS